MCMSFWAINNQLIFAGNTITIVISLRCAVMSRMCNEQITTHWFQFLQRMIVIFYYQMIAIILREHMLLYCVHTICHNLTATVITKRFSFARLPVFSFLFRFCENHRWNSILIWCLFMVIDRLKQKPSFAGHISIGFAYLFLSRKKKHHWCYRSQSTQIIKLLQTFCGFLSCEMRCVGPFNFFFSLVCFGGTSDNNNNNKKHRFIFTRPFFSTHLFVCCACCVIFGVMLYTMDLICAMHVS